MNCVGLPPVSVMAAVCKVIVSAKKRTALHEPPSETCLFYVLYRNFSNASRTASAEKQLSPFEKAHTVHSSSHPFAIHRSSVGRVTPKASAKSFLQNKRLPECDVRNISFLCAASQWSK